MKRVCTTALLIAVLLSSSVFLPKTASGISSPQVAADQVELWITQLSSGDFSIRNRAARSLWQAGPAVIDQLAAAQTAAGPEAAAAMQQLLILLRTGLTADSPPQILRAAAEFSATDYYQRTVFAEMLIAQDYDELLLQLIEFMPGEDQIVTMMDESWVGAALGKSIRDDRRELLDRWYQLESLRYLRPLGATVYLAEKGEIDQTLERLRGEIQLGSSAELIETAQLIMLRLLAVEDRHHEVQSMLDRLPAVPALADFRLLWELQRSTPEQLSAELQKSANLLAENRGFSPLQQFLIHRWSGNESAAQNLLTAMQANLPADNVGRYLAELFSLNLESLPFDSTNQKTLDHFDLLVWQGRIDEALAMVGLPENLAERSEWFERQLRRLRSLHAKRERTFDEAAVENYQTQFYLLLNISRVLGECGLRDESAYFLNNIAATYDPDSYSVYTELETLVTTLVEIQAHQVARDVAVVFDPAQRGDFISALYPQFQSNFYLAESWNESLTSEYPDLRERIRRIDQILWKSTDGTQAQAMESLLPFAYAAESTYAFEMVGVTCAEHGRQDLAVDLFREAASHGHFGALEQLYEWEMERGNTERAWRWIERAWNHYESPASAIKAALCASQLDRNDDAERYFDLAAYAAEFDFFSGADDFGALMQENSESDRWESKLNRWRKILELDWEAARELYLERAGGAVKSSEQLLDLQKLILMLVRVEDIDSRQMIALLSRVCQVECERGLAMIESGNIAAGVAIVDRVFGVAPNLSASLERLLPRLRELGQHDLANRWLAQFEQHCLSVLRRYPDYATYLNRYAWICAIDNHQLDRASLLIQRAIELDPDNASYLDTLAEIEFRQGQVTDAIEHNRQCLVLDADSEHYRRQRVRFLESVDSSTQ